MFDKKKYAEQYYKNNREKYKKLHESYYENNREECKKRARQWYQDNHERARKRLKQWRKDNPEKVKEQRNRRYKRRKKYISGYKLSKGCTICGYNKCAAALEFHHNGDKEFDIANAIANNYSFKKINEEMDKCDILCSNCHRELHEKENKK